MTDHCETEEESGPFAAFTGSWSGLGWKGALEISFSIVLEAVVPLQCRSCRWNMQEEGFVINIVLGVEAQLSQWVTARPASKRPSGGTLTVPTSETSWAPPVKVFRNQTDTFTRMLQHLQPSHWLPGESWVLWCLWVEPTDPTAWVSLLLPLPVCANPYSELRLIRFFQLRTPQAILVLLDGLLCCDMSRPAVWLSSLANPFYIPGTSKHRH